jgi:hypothetical protein
VQNDLSISGVSIVPVAAPLGWREINLDVAGLRGRAVPLNDGAVKIRPRFAIPKTRMQDAHGASVARREPIAEQALMQPDLLEQPFRRRAAGLAHARNPERGAAPFGVKIRRNRRHLRLLSRSVNGSIPRCRRGLEGP